MKNNLVIGLYDSSSEAEDSIEILTNEGVSRSDIELIEYSEKKEEHGFFKSLFNMGGGKDLSPDDLKEMGIPSQDAAFYTEAVKDGLSLLIIRCNDKEAEHTLALLNKTHLSDYGAPPSQREAGTGTTKRQEEYSSGSAGTSEGSQRFEEVDEELHVGKRAVETGGVRVSSTVHEEDVEEEIELKEETLHVERHDIDRPAEAKESAFKEETLEFTETREEPMVEKEARVTGEVVIGKDVERETETFTDTLRHKEVVVEDLYALADEDTGRFEQYEPQFRSHYDENYGAMAGSGADDRFDEYSTGYRFGMALAEHEPHRDMTWEQVEPTARESWEAHNAGTWDEYHDSVRYGWQWIRGDEESRTQPSKGV